MKVFPALSQHAAMSGQKRPFTQKNVDKRQKAEVTELRYAESEGPTKANYGENDEDVISRNGL